MKNKTNVLLCLLFAAFVFLVNSIQILTAGLDSSFFAHDPDVAYVGNGLSYLINGTTYYASHPGVQTAQLIALLNFPLKIYHAIFAQGPSFKEWLFIHFDLVLLYNRLAQAAILSLALFIFMLAIFRLSHSLTWTALVGVCILVFPNIPSFGVAIVNENTTLLILAVWSWFFVSFWKEPWNRAPLYLMAVLAGVAVSNKFTNVGLWVATCLLAFLPASDNKFYWERTIKVLVIIFISFYMGLLPIQEQANAVFNWAWMLVTHSGMYGTGEKTFFSFSAYIESLKILYYSNQSSWIVMIGGSFIMLIASPLRSPGKQLIPLAVFIWVLVLYFAKYPLIKYQLTFYFFILLFATVRVSQLGVFLKFWKKVMAFAGLIALVPTMTDNLQQQNKQINDLIIAAKNLSSFINSNPPKKGTLWECCRSLDYSYFYVNDWARGFFNEELSKLRPTLYAIVDGNFQEARQNDQRLPIFEACWDHFYIQTLVLPQFLEKYSDRKFKTQEIPATEMSLVLSDHCTK